MVQYSKFLVGGDADGLCLHTGLFKVASGEDITKAEQPGTFDLKVCFLLKFTSMEEEWDVVGMIG